MIGDASPERRVGVVKQHIAAALEEDDLELDGGANGAIEMLDVPPLDHELSARRRPGDRPEDVLARAHDGEEIVPERGDQGHVLRDRDRGIEVVGERCAETHVAVAAHYQRCEAAAAEGHREGRDDRRRGVVVQVQAGAGDVPVAERRRRDRVAPLDDLHRHHVAAREGQRVVSALGGRPLAGVDPVARRLVRPEAVVEQRHGLSVGAHADRYASVRTRAIDVEHREIDRGTDTIRRGRYYSDPVKRGGPGSDEWLYDRNHSRRSTT